VEGKKMKIDLMIGEAEKTFRAEFVSGLVFRKFLELRTKHNLNDMEEEAVEEVVGLIVQAYNNQFTVDEFWSGKDARKIMPTISEFLQELTTGKESPEGK